MLPTLRPIWCMVYWLSSPYASWLCCDLMGCRAASHSGNTC